MRKDNKKNISENSETKDKNKSKKRKHNIVFIFVMAVILFSGTYILYNQYEYTLELNRKNADILAQIDNEKKVTEKINNQEKYYNSDEYVEKIAREQLSLVKPNEILFYDIN